MASQLAAKFKYGTPLHDRVKNAVLERLKLAQLKQAEHISNWDKAEELYRAYIKRSTEDQLRKNRRDQKGEQQLVEIFIPYSYAVALTAHTYLSSVFLSRTPVFQYTGRHGEAQQNVQAVEAFVDYQMTVGQNLVPLYFWLLDAVKYGFGVVGNYWAEEMHQLSTIEEVPVTFFGVPIPGKTKQQRVVRRMRGYAGNKLFNVRAYDFYPDPRVPLARLQDGEFCGRRVSVGWNQILKRASDGDYFNLDKLVELKREGTRNYEAGSHTMDMPLIDSPTQIQGPGGIGPQELVELTIELSASEWGLGEQSYPEKWVFTLAQNEVIIGARPLGEIHNQFPYFLQFYELEPYGHTPRGIPDITRELNLTMNWLFNSHFFNVRKVLNDQFIYDPSRVVEKDLLDGRPGKMIRLKPEAFGQDVRTVVTQLGVVDVTGSHLADSQLVAETIQRITGATDNIQGMLASRGRKTATEVRTSSSFGINRLKTLAEFNSALGWGPLSQVMLQNSQQHYDEERQFKIAGDLIEATSRYRNISTEDIMGFYDFVPVDGTMPIDRMAQATLWKELMAGAMQMPQVAQQYDMAKIFAWVAQTAGLKNINQFKIQVAPSDSMLPNNPQMVPLPQPPGTPGGSGAMDMLGQNQQGNNQYA